MWNRPEYQGAWEGRKAGYEDLEWSEEQRAGVLVKDELRSVGKSQFTRRPCVSGWSILEIAIKGCK